MSRVAGNFLTCYIGRMYSYEGLIQFLSTLGVIVLIITGVAVTVANLADRKDKP